MNLGPLHWNMALREHAVKVWLDDLSRKPRFQQRRWRYICLRDAYERGYIHGQNDAKSGQERPDA